MLDPTPSPAALDAVRARVAALGGWAALGDDRAVLAALAADATANPAPRADVPAPFSAADLIAACPSQAGREVLVDALKGSAAALVLAGDRAHLKAGLDAFAAAGHLAAAVKARLDLTASE